MHANIAYPLALRVAPSVAQNLVKQLPHARCRKAAERHWSIDSNGSVPEESVNWLFCWAKTGMGSELAAKAARQAFDQMFPISFQRYDALVSHEYARSHRYGYQM